MLVPGKDGCYRLVIDYRKLNSKTFKTSWPLPRIQVILGSLQGSCYFSNLDLATGFHQMKIEEEDQRLASFITPFGFYQWKRMPMRLFDAPGTFQRLMELVLTYKIVLVYIDDIINYGRSFEEHLKNLAIPQVRIEKSNFKQKYCPQKVNSFKNISRMEFKPVQLLINFYPVPKMVKQVRAFLGLT